MNKRIALKTYAKINISLDVTGVRADGYHEVEMVMQGIDLYDEMTVRCLPSDQPRITVKTDKFYIPTDERNTAFKAARLMREKCRIPQCEIRIDIKKQIPVAAGLAGGSSNAAGVILALNYLCGLGLTLEEMCSLGGMTGADVPFSIMLAAHENPDLGIKGGAACALAQGTGVELTPLKTSELWVTLAKPPVGASTRAVYTELDKLDSYPRPDNANCIKAIGDADLKLLEKSMANSLEAVTENMVPQVGQLKALLVEAGGAVNEETSSEPGRAEGKPESYLDLKNESSPTADPGMKNENSPTSISTRRTANALKSEPSPKNEGNPPADPGIKSGTGSAADPALYSESSPASDPIMMSGSGPTVYGIYADRNRAEKVFEYMKSHVEDPKTELFCVKMLV